MIAPSVHRLFEFARPFEVPKCLLSALQQCLPRQPQPKQIEIGILKRNRVEPAERIADPTSIQLWVVSPRHGRKAPGIHSTRQPRNRGCKRYKQRKIERLYEESCRLKKEVLELTDGERIPLSPEQRRLLAKKAPGIDPEVLKRISVFDPQDLALRPPNDKSTESP